ncbi:MAG: hypothetical protein LC687_00620 [Actinobacteria bacterium]|nr:hypothetical protein [Actinomycetota bacterium]
MLHKTLNSYYSNVPYSEDQEHPDGPLWTIGSDRDWDMIPQGVYLEHVRTGKHVIYDDSVEQLHGVYGIRGYRA